MAGEQSVKKSNPSVVKEGGASNYNLSRGGLAKSDLDYIQQLDKTLSNPPAGPLPAGEMFPSAGRPIRAGQVSSKTLGSVPLFAAGRGLLPVGMLEAKKQADYKASMQRFAMFGPENNDVFDQYVELANPLAQDSFNAKLQGEINDMLDKVAVALGGDYGKARMALKHMPQYKNMINSYKNYGRGYNFVFGQAMQVIQDAQDPTKYTDPETVEMALKFFKNHDDISIKGIEELEAYVNKFKSHMSVDVIAKSALAGLGERVTTTIKERADMSTDANIVFETVQSKGVYTDVEINQMVEDTAASFPWIKNDPESKALLKRKIKNGITTEVEKAIQAVRKDYNAKRLSWGNMFGMRQYSDGSMHGTDMIGFTKDGKEYNTEYVNIPGKVNTASGGMQQVQLNLASNEYVTLKDQNGNITQGYFNTMFDKISPKRMYKDENGELQVLSMIDASIMQPRQDEYGRIVPGVQKGDVKFNVVGGDILDVTEMAGRYEIIMPEMQVGGQLMGYFDENGWNEMTSKVKTFPVGEVKGREHAPRVQLLFMTEAQALTDESRKKTRIGMAKKSKESGIDYIILNDMTFNRPDAAEGAKGYSYDDLIKLEYTPERIKQAVEQGALDYE